mgnify:CR=1 FL=1
MFLAEVRQSLELQLDGTRPKLRTSFVIDSELQIARKNNCQNRNIENFLENIKFSK